MLLLLDQGIPRTAAQRLRDIKIDAVHVGELGMSVATDAEIIEFAKREDRMIVTLDSDFHTLLALAGANTPSVIRIRIEGLKAPAYLSLLTTILAECEQDLNEGGCAITVSERQIRIHRLPLR
jgi:predicted nuclease of predicted toxin-antitoxin system